MKKFFYAFGSLILVIFSVSEASAQDRENGQWSCAAIGGFDYSTSSAMHGTIDQYKTNIQSGRTATEYPFGGNRFYSIGLEAQFAYRYAKSPLSVYLGGYGSSFNAGYGFRFSQSARFKMSIGTATAGLEYTFGQLYQHWNFFGRLGLNSSIIVGNYRSGGPNRFMDTTLLTSGLRFGFEAELGERYNFSRSRFGVEASLNYSNLNLIGKTYTAPVLQQGVSRNVTGSINDGKNPNDSADSPRVIDYLSFRLGARIYL